MFEILCWDLPTAEPSLGLSFNDGSTTVEFVLLLSDNEGDDIEELVVSAGEERNLLLFNSLWLDPACSAVCPS